LAGVKQQSAPVDLAILLSALVVGTLVAELFGAANLGVALTFGTMAFLLAVLALIVLPRDD
jgi:hypothetical protein